jgi:hypothetical protein
LAILTCFNLDNKNKHNNGQLNKALGTRHKAQREMIEERGEMREEV